MVRPLPDTVPAKVQADDDDLDVSVRN